jgi:hypothetical protein
MKEGFKSIDEILEEVAKDEGMTLKETTDLWNHQKKYIKDQMDKEGVYAIFLPFVGTLSLNTKQYVKEIRGKVKELYLDFINKAEKLKEHENYTYFKNSHKKVTGVNRLARYIIRYYDTGVTRGKKLMAHNKCWDIIYKYSNNNYSKRDKAITRKKDE